MQGEHPKDIIEKDDIVGVISPEGGYWVAKVRKFVDQKLTIYLYKGNNNNFILFWFNIFKSEADNGKCTLQQNQKYKVKAEDVLLVWKEESEVFTQTKKIRSKIKKELQKEAKFYFH